jgi:hypothetical protein
MKISNEFLNAIRPELEAAIKAIGSKHGLEIQIGRFGYDSEGFTGRLTAKTKSSLKAVEASSPVEKGARYKVKNTIFTIVNFHPNKPKFSIETRTQTGKIYFTTPGYLQSGVKL